MHIKHTSQSILGKVSKMINSNEVHIYWEVGIKSSVQRLEELLTHRCIYILR